MDHVTMDVGQTEFPTLIPVGESFVVKSQEVQDGRIEVVNMNSVLGDIHSEVIRLPVTDSAFDSAASEPHCVRVFVMVAAGESLVFRVTTLSQRSSAEF